jgi:hypothetical protein
MNVNADYELLDQSGNTIAMGTKDQIFSIVKHHVPDGRYCIVGTDLKVHCIRKDGIVQPDPDGVCLQAKRIRVSLADILFTDPPYGDKELEDDGE